MNYKYWMQRLFSLYHSWSNEEIAKWQLTQSKGKLKFILEHGILVWGFISCSVFLASSHNSITIQAENPITHVTLTIILWILASICYGLTVWWATKESYKRK